MARRWWNSSNASDRRTGRQTSEQASKRASGQATELLCTDVAKRALVQIPWIKHRLQEEHKSRLFYLLFLPSPILSGNGDHLLPGFHFTQPICTNVSGARTAASVALTSMGRMGKHYSKILIGREKAAAVSHAPLGTKSRADFPSKVVVTCELRSALLGMIIRFVQ